MVSGMLLSLKYKREGNPIIYNINIMKMLYKIK